MTNVIDSIVGRLLVFSLFLCSRFTGISYGLFFCIPTLFSLSFPNKGECGGYSNQMFMHAGKGQTCSCFYFVFF